MCFFIQLSGEFCSASVVKIVVGFSLEILANLVTREEYARSLYDCLESDKK